MKKIKLFGAALGLAATLGFGNLASAAGSEYISFSYRPEGTDQAIECFFYNSNGIPDGKECGSSYGSYNSGRNTLALGQDVNKPNGRLVVNNSGHEHLDNLVISADSNIEINIYAQNTSLILDFGEYSFTDTLYKYSDSDDGVFSSFSDSDLTVRSGTFNNMRFSVESINVEGGVINTRPREEGPHATIPFISDSDITISGGTINIPSCNIAFNAKTNISISGGTINATDISGAGFRSYGEFAMTGGDVNIKATKGNNDGFGIWTDSGKDIDIQNGNITIDGFYWGINTSKAKILFEGGTTSIKNSKIHTVWIVPALDPENDIVFGEDMGIKEDTYVFWTTDDDNELLNSTGIAESGTVTIAKGYKYRRHYGYEDIDDETEAEETTKVKVPDTGVFSGENGGAVMMAISLGALTAVMGGIYIVAYVVKRKKSSVKFNR